METIPIIVAYIGPGAGITFLGSFAILLAAVGLVVFSILTWPIRFLWSWIRFAGRRTPGGAKRVVVVGLDGLDPRRIRRLMSEGKLPHFQRLAEEGSFTELQTTLPPISPVAWSSFMTGVNPGKHNIFDFLNRDLRTYLPELSSAKIVRRPRWQWLQRLGASGEQMRLLRKSRPFWHVLGEYGVFSTILRVPITFPPERFHGLLLSAMCTPDLRGTQGSFTLYSTNQAECETATGGVCVHVARNGDCIDTTLPGPPNQPGRQPAELQLPLRIQLDPRRDQGTLDVGGNKIRLKCGEYSPWVRITYRAGAWMKVHGICRFRLEAVTPEFRLYVTPINIDPERPAMAISHPLYYSMYLAKLHDSFATLGLAEDTWALNTRAIDEEAFLEQAYTIHNERERMFFDALERTRRGLCACVFDLSDRVQHMFYRYDNPDHPANAGKKDFRNAGVIDEMYAQMDALVGRVLNAIDDETALLVLSDHGFCEFSRGVNLNAWLREQGHLVLRAQAAGGDYLVDVDWSKTRAYAFGLSGIYLNLAGRESQGLVQRGAEAAALKKEIAEKLRQLQDVGRHGSHVDFNPRDEPAKRPILDVYDVCQAYSGPYVENGPDLVIGYNRGYRASWENAVGRTDGPVFSDNTRAWSGDHCVDPSTVPGVLFSNRPFRDDAPAIVDLAPTILKLFGVPVPTYMDGKPLNFVARPKDERGRKS